MFQNFNGLADHFVLWKESKELPLRLPKNGYESDDKDDNALISLRFNETTDVIGVEYTCLDPLEIPLGFTDQEYFEYYTR